MRYLLLLLLSINLFAVDATLKIETDVEHRSRIALVDGSVVPNDKFFKILLSDLKISGHFLADTTRHEGDITSNFIEPALKSKEYILKYAFSQSTGTKLVIIGCGGVGGPAAVLSKKLMPEADVTIVRDEKRFIVR